MREPKESPWKMSEPASFRSWVKRSMSPLAYDKALKKKNALAVGYFFCSLITLNVVIYQHFVKKPEGSTVEPENKTLQIYLASTPAIKESDDVKVQIYNYENFKFKSAEHIDRKELQKNRLE